MVRIGALAVAALALLKHVPLSRGRGARLE